MDTVTFIEKIASDNAEFSVKLASDIMAKVNEKLAEAKIAAGRLPTGDYLKLLASVTGEAKDFMSKRLNMARQLTDPDVVRQTYQAAKQTAKPTTVKNTTSKIVAPVAGSKQQPKAMSTLPAPHAGVGSSEAAKLYGNKASIFDGLSNSGYTSTVNR